MDGSDKPPLFAFTACHKCGEWTGPAPPPNVGTSWLHLGCFRPHLDSRSRLDDRRALGLGGLCCRGSSLVCRLRALGRSLLGALRRLELLGRNGRLLTAAACEETLLTEPTSPSRAGGGALPESPLAPAAAISFFALSTA